MLAHPMCLLTGQGTSNTKMLYILFNYQYHHMFLVQYCTPITRYDVFNLMVDLMEDKIDV